MKAYIRSASAISPQNTFNKNAYLDDVVVYKSNRLSCIEPDYSEFIPHKASRRMSRIIKMSVTTAMACLKQAGITHPDAIITGTAYGCLEDTGTFLTNMIEQNEEPLSPVAFVQSTHNTIGAQIALLNGSDCYNNTFVNGGASFENTLTDAMMVIADNPKATVLAGGMDEITNDSFAILSRTGIYKRQPAATDHLFNTGTKGTVAGEGSTFFLLTGQPSANDMAKIEAVYTFFKPANNTIIATNITEFLAAESLNIDDIDLLVTGINGDIYNDAIYHHVTQKFFYHTPSTSFKHLCGEYPTATAFAVWLASNIVKTNTIPGRPEFNNPVKKVLIYNHYQNIHHSLILLSAC